MRCRLFEIKAGGRLSILDEYQIRFQNVEEISQRVVVVKDSVMTRFTTCYRLLDELNFR